MSGGDYGLSIVKHKDKRSGVTYFYESTSYWDKEKKQPRSHRTLIGKLDEETGEIVPTGKSGRRKSTVKTPEGVNEKVPAITGQVELLAVKDALITELRAENKALKREKQELLNTLKLLCQKLSD